MTCIVCNTVNSSFWYHGTTCENCYRKIRYKNIAEKKREQARKRYKKNKDKILVRSKDYYKKNSISLKEKSRDYYLTHKDERKKKCNDYYIKNKEKIIKRTVLREKNKINTSMVFLLKKRIKSRLKMAIKSNYKTGMAIDSLGCSIEHLKTHLELKFTEGMTWNNYGEWEIDHVIPLCSIDPTDYSDIFRVCHYTNLQPLWKKDHLKKTQNDVRNWRIKMSEEQDEKKHGTLYKKLNKNIHYWKVKVCRISNEVFVQVEFGQMGTNKPQITKEQIKTGKNIGKRNETSVYDQANIQALQMIDKKLKSGYVPSLEDAKNDVVDDIIEGGILPMLAHTFAKQGDKIKFPCLGQPKLDGLRLIAVLNEGKCTLYSRTRKLVTGIPHIAKAIEEAFPGQTLVLDGEAYSHAYKKDFEKILHYVRQDTPAIGHEVVEFHIYDYPHPTMKQTERTKLLESFNFKPPLVLVETVEIQDEVGMINCFNQFLKEGFEGLMLRNKDGLYVNKRSTDLIKVKEFEDSEFKIVGIEEGRGKLAGHVGSFVCETPEGKTFNAKMNGDTSKLKEYFEDHSLWQNKMATVQHQGYSAYKIPRFPVLKAIRWDV